MTRWTAAGSSWWKIGSFAGWRAALLGNPGSPVDDSALDRLARNKGKYSDDLRGLVDVIERVRRRVFANRFLGGWMVWLTWVFLGLIAAAGFRRQLKYVLISAICVAAGGVIASFAVGWWKRPSAYYCAREIDRAAGLSDRLSTALYFGSIECPDPMALRQRRDAVSKVGGLEPRALFPVRMPEFADRTVVLALIALALLAYRLHYNPPMMALLQRAATSQVAKAVMSPLAGAVKKELLSLVNRDESEIKEAPADAETVPGLAESKSADDASQPGDKEGAAPGDMQDDSETATAGAEGNPSDPQGGNPSQAEGQDVNQAGNSSQNQQMADANQPPSGENGQNGSSQQQQAGNQQSSSSSVMQALKNLMKNMTGQPTASDSEGQSSAAGSSQQPGSSSAQGEAKNDTPKDGSEQKENGSSSSSQKPGGGAGNGSTPVPKQPGKEALPPSKNLTADRVNLDASDFRQQGRVRTTSAAGTAQLPLRDIKPQPVTAIKGAEQENIPVRYRLYVQRYFEHSDKTPGQIQPPQ
jgi:hypothetical protein